MTRFKNALLEELETMVAATPVPPQRRPSWGPRAAIVAGTAAVLTVGVVAGAPFGRLAPSPKAWAVTDEGDGVVKVKVYEEIEADPEGLERRLEELGIPTYVIAMGEWQTCINGRWESSTSPYAIELRSAKREDGPGAVVELTIDRDRLAPDETVVIKQWSDQMPPPRPVRPGLPVRAMLDVVDLAKGDIDPCDVVDIGL